MNRTSEKRSLLPTIFALIAIVAAVLLVFLPVCRFEFVSFDDNTNVYNNVFLNPVTPKTLPRFWSESYFELYTPITYSIWTLGASLPGAQLAQPVLVPAGAMTSLNAAVFHRIGLIFHLANTLLVFALLSRLPALKNRSPLYAALGTLLFAVHPFAVESVAWVTGNNNLFSGFFLLIALLLFTRRLEATNERTALLWYIAATMMYGLALLAKPTAAALPFMAFVLAVGAYRTPVRALLLPLGVWLVLAGALLFVTRNTSSPVTDVSLPVWQRPFVAGDALAFYLGKLLVPVKMGIDYGRKPELLREQNWFYLTWLVPVSVGVALLFWYRRTKSEVARLCVTGAAVFVFAVAPMLGLAPYYFHRYSTVADRYVYLAMVGAGLIVAVVLSQLPRRFERGGIALVSVIMVGYAFLCSRQVMVWQNSRSLYEQTVRVYPKSMMGHNNLSLVFMDTNDLNSALREADIAVECPPQGKLSYSVAATSRGAILFTLRRLPEAAEEYRKAIAQYPNRLQPYENLAITLYDLGNKEGARQALEAGSTAEGPRENFVYDIALLMLQNNLPDLGMPYMVEAAKEGYPHAAEANFILGVQSGNQGNNAAAESYFRKALQLNPSWGEAAYSIGKILERQGKIEDAKPYFAQAQQLGYRSAPAKPVQ